MSKFKQLSFVLVVLLMTGTVFGATVALEISGDGALNDSTIIAGEPFSADIYFTNDSVWLGFTIGFKWVSDDIRLIKHPIDSGNGVNDRGDVKAYNGWEDQSIWDMQGLFVVESDWDGTLPEILGLGGICIKQSYKPHERQKCVSVDLVIPSEGTIVIDSSFWPPSGKWLYAGPNQSSAVPDWEGPYKFKVVNKSSVKEMPAAEEKGKK